MGASHPTFSLTLSEVLRQPALWYMGAFPFLVGPYLLEAPAPALGLRFCVRGGLTLVP